MLDTSKLPAGALSDVVDYITENFYSVTGSPISSVPEDARDAYILSHISKLDPATFFRYYCEWNGLLGWAGTLTNVIDCARNAKL